MDKSRLNPIRIEKPGNRVSDITACGMSMRVQVQLRIVADDDSVISDDTELLLLDKSDDRLEALGLSLAEAKAAAGRRSTAPGHRPGGELCGPASGLPALRPATR